MMSSGFLASSAKRRKPMMEHREADDLLEMMLESGHEKHNSSRDDDGLSDGQSSGNGVSSSRQLPFPGTGPRVVKMYELDPGLFPEAAAARASYENRIRKKSEKERQLMEIEDLKRKNELLESENELLREQLNNIESHDIDSYDWLGFFRQAGIKPGIDLKYALIFERNRVKPHMLKNLTEGNLRDMRISALGDIFSILQFARSAFETEKVEEVVQPKNGSPTVSSTSSASQLTTTKEEITLESSDDEYEDEEAEGLDNGLRIVQVRSLSELD